MRVRIGTRWDGIDYVIDTSSASLIRLVGDPGTGKTTAARFLARWWIADPRRTARAFAEHPHQYADLTMRVRPRAELEDARAAVDATVLTIIDGADEVHVGTLRCHAESPGLTILTSSGEAAQAFDGSGQPCLALLGRDHDPGQGRLDWPSDVVPLIPDPRGERDLPAHRWHLTPGHIEAAQATG